MKLARIAEPKRRIGNRKMEDEMKEGNYTRVGKESHCTFYCTQSPKRGIKIARFVRKLLIVDNSLQCEREFKAKIRPVQRYLTWKK